MQTPEASEPKLTRSFPSSGLALVVPKGSMQASKEGEAINSPIQLGTQEPQLLSQHNDPQYRCNTVIQAFEESGSSLIRLKTSPVKGKSHLVLEI